MCLCYFTISLKYSFIFGSFFDMYSPTVLLSYFVFFLFTSHSEPQKNASLQTMQIEGS